MEITIESGVAESLNITATTGEIRIFTSKTYATPDNQIVISGKNNPQETRYESVPVSFGSDCVAGQCGVWDAFQTDSTTDGAPNASRKSFILYDDVGAVITELGCNLYINPTPTTQTLAEIITYNQSPQPDLPPSYYTAEQVDVLLAALVGAAQNATTTTPGVLKASQPPAGVPVAVITDDKRWLALNESYFLENASGDMSALLTTIGASQAEIVITCPYAPVIDYNIPKNVLIRIEGDGIITPATGTTFTINSLGALGNRQYFFGTGTGKVVLGRGAINEINATWFAPYNETADQTTAIRNLLASAANQGLNGGAVVTFGAGKWLCSEVTLPKMVTIQCAGMDPDAGSFSPFAYSGTVFKLYDETKAFLFKIIGGARNIALSNCALTVGAAPAASCIDHTITEYTDGIFFENVSVQGTVIAATRDDATPLIEFHATASQESIRHDLQGVWFQVPENGVGYHCDSANTTITFSNCKGQVGKNGVVQSLRNCGPVYEDDNCDWEGTGDYTDLAYVFQRSISLASVAQIPDQADPGVGQPFALMTLDASTPSNKQFTENDILRRVAFGSWDVGAYIVRIDSAFEAVLSFYPSVPIVSAPCTIQTFTDFPNTAYAVRLYDGNIVSGTFNSSIDEGFNFSFVGGCGTSNNFQFNNCYSQGRFEIIESLKIDINGGHLPSCAFEDALGEQSLTVNINDVVFGNNCYANQLFTITPQVWRIQRIVDGVSASYTPHVSGVFPSYDMFTDTYDFVSPTISSTQWEMFADYGVAVTDPVLGLYTKVIHGDVDVQKALLRIGQKNPLTGAWTFYYDDLRNEQTGRKQTIGNQTGQGGLVGWDFNGDIYVSNFRGGTIYPAQITGNQSAYTGAVGPNTEGLYDVQNVRVTTNADDLHISGITFDYTTADGTPPDSARIRLTNNGTHRIALTNNDAATTDARIRLRTCTGQTLFLMPSCSADLVYNVGDSGAVERWDTSLDGVPFSPIFEGAARLNTLTIITPGPSPVVSGVLGDRFSLTPSVDATITATGISVGQFMYLTIITSGTTSRKLVFSTGFTNVPVFNTGNFDAITYELAFMESNGTWIMIGDKPRPVLALTPGTTVAVDASVAKRFTLTPAQSCTLNITGYSVGDVLDFDIVTSGTSTYNVTFGTNFFSQGVLATGTASGKQFVLSFVEFFNAMCERCRTTAM